MRLTVSSLLTLSFVGLVFRCFLSLPSPIPTDLLPATVLIHYWIPFDRTLVSRYEHSFISLGK